MFHCSNCGGALQRRLPTPLFGRDVFPTTCKCRAKLYEKQRREQQARQNENTVKAYRSVCFHKKRMEKWTFENDDGSNLAMRFARSYVKDWEQVRKESVGLLLWGGVGVGTDFSSISNISAFDSAEYVRSLSSYDLLIIDDYGTE